MMVSNFSNSNLVSDDRFKRDINFQLDNQNINIFKNLFLNLANAGNFKFLDIT